MNEIYIFKDGKTIPAKIERLFETHGPYTIEGQRLDLLTKVQLLVDSSTTSTSQSGTSTSKINAGSMVGRAVVGGVLTGGAGAIIGGLSGKRESDINTISSETLHTELTAELIFEGGNFMYVLIKSMESFHWLLAFANQHPMTDGELEVEKNKALNAKFEMQLDEAHHEAISVVGYPRYGNKEAVKKTEAEILETTFKILQNIPDVARALDYSEFVNIYQNTFPQINIELNKQAIDYNDKYSGSGQRIFLLIAIPLITFGASFKS